MDGELRRAAFEALVEAGELRELLSEINPVLLSSWL